MNHAVAKSDQVPGSRESLQKTLAMDSEGMIPHSIRGGMLAVPCKRMLRAIYGSAWRAIIAWAWQKIRNDASWAWYRVRSRVYRTKAEREMEARIGGVE